ncbi:MAG: hypothetical protein JSR21_04215 [Proteobacteria bacterium]|nr:hypothetical protein [Pseudomonadota bacterium]
MIETLQTISAAAVRPADPRGRFAWLPDRLSAYRGVWRDEEGKARLPLGLILLAAVAVSLGLWAGIVLVVVRLL